MKATLGVRVLRTFVRVQIGMRREALPAFVAKLGATAQPVGRRYEPERLSRAVEKTLQLGSHRPRCLVNALVLFRLLREQGDRAELVIGLPIEAKDHSAHAWVEIGGRDVGPAPGRAGHDEMARFV